MQPDIHGINTAGYSDDFSALAACGSCSAGLVLKEQDDAPEGSRSLPLLSLRNLVLFPGAVMPVEIGRLSRCG